VCYQKRLEDASDQSMHIFIGPKIRIDHTHQDVNTVTDCTYGECVGHSSRSRKQTGYKSASIITPGRWSLKDYAAEPQGFGTGDGVCEVSRT